jgi:hypothetical protein
LALEAELQEIVAEERAQRLSDGVDVAERLPAER